LALYHTIFIVLCLSTFHSCSIWISSFSNHSPLLYPQEYVVLEVFLWLLNGEKIPLLLTLGPVV
ncbi:hypothetical protein ACQP3F_34765, partial [Escherichia coli]